MLKLSLGALCAMGVICGPVAAAEARPPVPGEVQEVVVFGRAEAKIGIAHAASEGTISGSDMLVRPLLKTGCQREMKAEWDAWWASKQCSS